MDEFVDVIGSAGLRSSQLANLLVNVRESFFGSDVLLDLLIDTDVEGEHLVVLLQGQLSLGVGGDVGAVVDGESLQASLSGHRVIALNGAIAGTKR